MAFWRTSKGTKIPVADAHEREVRRIEKQLKATWEEIREVHPELSAYEDEIFTLALDYRGDLWTTATVMLGKLRKKAPVNGPTYVTIREDLLDDLKVKARKANDLKQSLDAVSQERDYLAGKVAELKMDQIFYGGRESYERALRLSHERAERLLARARRMEAAVHECFNVVSQNATGQHDEF